MNKEIIQLVEQDKAESELNFWCEMLLNLTKEYVENKSRAVDWLFTRAYRDIWILKKAPTPLASVKAYNLFMELTGHDIRNFDWEGRSR